MGGETDQAHPPQAPILSADEPAGVRGMTLRHTLRGSAAHTLAVTLRTAPHACGGDECAHRMWIAVLGQGGRGAEHWIYGGTDEMPLQVLARPAALPSLPGERAERPRVEVCAPAGSPARLPQPCTDARARVADAARGSGSRPETTPSLHHG